MGKVSVWGLLSFRITDTNRILQNNRKLQVDRIVGSLTKQMNELDLSAGGWETVMYHFSSRLFTVVRGSFEGESVA